MIQDDVAAVSAKGARRWQQGHPWIYRSDVTARPSSPAGAVRVVDQRGKPIGVALWSPASEISLRMVDRDPRATLDRDWWMRRIGDAIARRGAAREPPRTRTGWCTAKATRARRSICDRYDRWLVVQLMSAGLEAFRDVIIDSLEQLVQPDGILARNDVALRGKEKLAGRDGTAPRRRCREEIEIDEHGDSNARGAMARSEDRRVSRSARESRADRRTSPAGARSIASAITARSRSTSRARADTVVALDVSADALKRAGENCARNGITNVELVVADTFDYLRNDRPRGDAFDTIVLDPPAFAKTRASLPAAIRGYKDINLRAMRLLSRNGLLFTASCSFHLTKPLFLEMLHDAAADSGRRMAIRAITRPAARPSGGGDDSRDGIPQGSAAGGARLASESTEASETRFTATTSDPRHRRLEVRFLDDKQARS